MDLSRARIRRAFRETWIEIKARRAGRAGVPRPKINSPRQIAGITGALFSNGFDRIMEGQKAYEKSFEPHIPPSVHISYNDMRRQNVPVPLAERCIEDWRAAPRPEIDEELSAMIDEADPA